MIEYVDLATAQAATTGVRIVVAGFVPSPWSEATKGLFNLARVPALVTRAQRDNGGALKAWTGVDNVPVVLYDAEPARTNWAAIVGLAARLAGPDVLVPSDPRARLEVMGALELIAGEDGLGWCGRLAMIEASLVDGKGFAPPVGAYLGKRYAGRPVERTALRARVTAQLAVLAERLGDRAYYAGDRPGALDIYSATFLTPLGVIAPEACPRLAAPLRAGFDTCRALLGDLVPPALAAHRMRMLEQHLGWPIQL